MNNTVIRLALCVIIIASSIGIVTNTKEASAYSGTDFVIQIDTGSSTSFSVGVAPWQTSGYNFNVDCNGDGTFEFTNRSAQTICNYGSPGVYTVVINGSYPAIYWATNTTSHSIKVIDVLQWGNQQWQTMRRAFTSTSLSTMSAVDNPDLSQVTDMSEMFNSSHSFNSDISDWDVSNITNLSGTFAATFSFNQSLNAWDTSNVTTLESTFEQSAFDLPLNLWETGNVTSMYRTFLLSSFNQPLNTWDTSQVLTMYYMFHGAGNFNQNLDLWVTTNVASMSHMFDGATEFNGDVSTWNTVNVTDMAWMFSGAIAFNQPIGSWNLLNVADMEGMFYQATSFDQIISSWEFPNVTSLSNLFGSAEAFDKPLNSWDVSNITGMNSTFYNAKAFNQPLGSWETMNVESMNSMFYGASEFNQDISVWDTSSATTMAYMFARASLFDQDIGPWNTENVTDMSYMFYEAYAFDQDISAWNVENVYTMHLMFNNTRLSIANYDELLIAWSSQTLQTYVHFSAGLSEYCSLNAISSRANLVSAFQWTITDGGQDCTVDDGADITIDTSLDETTPVLSGETIGYTLILGNDGPDVHAGAVSLYIVIPSKTTYVSTEAEEPSNLSVVCSDYGLASNVAPSLSSHDGNLIGCSVGGLVGGLAPLSQNQINLVLSVTSNFSNGVDTLYSLIFGGNSGDPENDEISDALNGNLGSPFNLTNNNVSNVTYFTPTDSTTTTTTTTITPTTTTTTPNIATAPVSTTSPFNAPGTTTTGKVVTPATSPSGPNSTVVTTSTFPTQTQPSDGEEGNTEGEVDAENKNDQVDSDWKVLGILSATGAVIALILLCAFALLVSGWAFHRKSKSKASGL